MWKGTGKCKVLYNFFFLSFLSPSFMSNICGFHCNHKWWSRREGECTISCLVSWYVCACLLNVGEMVVGVLQLPLPWMWVVQSCKAPLCWVVEEQPVNKVNKAGSHVLGKSTPSSAASCGWSVGGPRRLFLWWLWKPCSVEETLRTEQQLKAADAS